MATETVQRMKLKNTLQEDIKKARAEGNTAKANALELLAGSISTGVGMLTGIPDIGIAGYNFLKDKKTPELKDLRSRILETGGFPTEATTPEGTIAYNVPEVGAAVYGIASLARSGWKFLKNRSNDKKIAEFLGELPTNEANKFKQYMVNGQGSSDPVVLSVIQKLKNNPKYAEFFTTLEKGATEAALKNMQPTATALSKEEATKGMVEAVTAKIDKVKKAGTDATTPLYEGAKVAGGGRPLVSTDNTLKTIRELIAEYSKKATPSSEKAVAFLRSMEERLVPTYTTEARAGTSVVREGTPEAVRAGFSPVSLKGGTEPSRVIPGAPSVTQTIEVPVPYIDNLGMPRTRMETRTITVPSRGATTVPGTVEPTRTIPGAPSTVIREGTPSTTLNIPGAPSTTVSQGPKRLTVEEVQSLLSEFGKKADQGDSLIKDISLSDERRISSAIFGNLKDDLKLSTAAVTASEDKKALGMLQSARELTRKNAEEYNKIIAQGIPKFLQGKNIEEIGFEDLQSAYEGLNPRQRVIFRDYVKSNNPEALQTLDKSVYDAFVAKHKTELPDGTFGYDLGSLARGWAKEDNLSLNDKDMIASALGQKASEFDKRMKDALVFTRRMSVGGVPAAPRTALEQAGSTLPAVVGSAGGYQAAKVTELTLDAANAFLKKGLSDEMLMKALMTPEGSSFLKNASMSPRSQKTLESLTKMTAVPSVTGVSATAGVGAGLVAPTTQQQEYVPPEDLFTAPEQQQEYVPPEDLFSEQTPVTGPTNKAEAAMAADIGTPDQMAQQMQQYYKPLYEGLRGDISSGAYAPQPEEMNFLRRAGLVQ